MSGKLLDPREINESNDSNLFGTPFIVDPMEAERMVENLSIYPIHEIGSSRWLTQHEVLEKLNLQAHQSARTHSDEFILESILTFSKIEFLIYDLLTIEAWKEFVYPLIVDKLAGRNSMRLYFILYHEATIINLLEVFLYHKHVCESGGERLLELVDYVARKLTKLNGGYDFRGMDSFDNKIADLKASIQNNPELTSTLIPELEPTSPVDELRNHLKEIEFRICISSVSILRFLCEHSDNLPLSVVSRIADTHDLLMLIIPLVENPPWTRRLKTGKWQKLVDFKWEEVPPIDLLKVTKIEGQIWISFYFLLAKQIFRERYHINSFRKGQILRLRKYLSEVILDQLPFLVDIQRYLDEMSITEIPDPIGGINGSNIFLFQQVSVVREKLLRDKDWNQIADGQIRDIFTMTDQTDEDMKRMALLYSNELVEDVIEPMAGKVEEEFEDL